MSFPNLALRAGSVLWAEATGIPDPGNNVFTIPFVASGVPASKVEEDWLVFFNAISPTTPGVVSATFVSLSADKTTVTMSFDADGVGVTTLYCWLVHSIPR